MSLPTKKAPGLAIRGASFGVAGFVAAGAASFCVVGGLALDTTVAPDPLLVAAACTEQTSLYAHRAMAVDDHENHHDFHNIIVILIESEGWVNVFFGSNHCNLR
jgi:hypothetical protein